MQNSWWPASLCECLLQLSQYKYKSVLTRSVSTDRRDAMSCFRFFQLMLVPAADSNSECYARILLMHCLHALALSIGKVLRHWYCVGILFETYCTLHAHWSTVHWHWTLRSFPAMLRIRLLSLKVKLHWSILQIIRMWNLTGMIW